MFPIAFITDEATQSLDEAIALATAKGIAGLELRSLDDQPIDAIDPDTLKRYARQIHAAGLKVPCLAGSLFKVDLTVPGALDRERQKLDRLMDAAQILGAPALRGFSGLRHPDTPQALHTLVPYFEAILPTLEHHHLKLYLEADPHVNTTNHRQIAALLDAIDHPLVGAIYDPGNCLYDPEHEMPYPEGYTAIVRHIGHVHIKDVAVDASGAPYCLKVGEGLVPFPEILAQLATDTYSGWISLETHYRSRTALSDAQMLHPSGDAFSEGGMEAMDESLDQVIAMVRALKQGDGS